MTTGLALTASDLVVHRGRREIVHGVDLAVAPGEIVVVLGPNGAGKSTLLGALGGLLRPAGGSVTSTGRVATVLQSPSLARRSAYANVKLATAWAGVARAERAERARSAMRLMQVDHLSSRPARTLSGGEQRRVHLARALAVAPDVLLLDEPFDGLDPETHETLREDAVAALRQAGTAAVFVLHDRRDAWAVADRLAVLVDGRLVAVGPVDDVVERPPTPEVARLLGFDGVLVRNGVHTHTRPAHVRIVEHGPWQATVERRYLTESGLRLRLRSAGGSVWTQHPSGSGFAVGDVVSFELVGGIDFEADFEADTDADTDANPVDEPRMTR